MAFKLGGPGSTVHGAWWIVFYGEIGFFGYCILWNIDGALYLDCIMELKIIFE